MKNPGHFWVEINIPARFPAVSVKELRIMKMGKRSYTLLSMRGTAMLSWAGRDHSATNRSR